MPIFFSNAGTAGGCLARSFPTAPRTSCVHALRLKNAPDDGERTLSLRASDGQPRQDRRQGAMPPRPAAGTRTHRVGQRGPSRSSRSCGAPLICDIGERHRPGTNLQPGKPTRGATQAPRGDLPLRGSAGDEFLGVDAGGIHAETVQRRLRRLDHRRRTAEIYFAIAGIQDLRTQ